MDDTSRNGEAHYGMGLFFAKTVAEKYGGGIKLQILKIQVGRG